MECRSATSAYRKANAPTVRRNCYGSDHGALTRFPHLGGASANKSPNAIIGPGETMVLPDVPATIFEGEAELAVVIGKRADKVNADDVQDCFGHNCTLRFETVATRRDVDRGARRSQNRQIMLDSRAHSRRERGPRRP
jgi:hypothetical protein